MLFIRQTWMMLIMIFDDTHEDTADDDGIAICMTLMLILMMIRDTILIAILLLVLFLVLNHEWQVASHPDIWPTHVLRDSW